MLEIKTRDVPVPPVVRRKWVQDKLLVIPCLLPCNVMASSFAVSFARETWALYGVGVLAVVLRLYVSAGQENMS
jgi:hypothetical protein